MALVSVVIPVYNIREDVERCLKSVMQQTYQTLEIIVVDDGSDDGSGEICDELAQRDTRIKVIHQKNQGLSDARNVGIKKARGDFVATVDGDDAVQKDYVEKMIQRAETFRADIVICGYNEVIPEAKVVSGREAALQLLVGQENLEIVAWNKLYRRELFSGIEYPSGEKNEDSLTTYKLLARAKKVAYVSESLYIYNTRTGSIMDRANASERLGQREKAAREAMDYFAEDGELEQAAEVALLLSKYAIYDAGLRGEVEKREMLAARQWILAHLGKYQGNPYLTKKLGLYNQLNRFFGGALYKALRWVRHE